MLNKQNKEVLERLTLQRGNTTIIYDACYWVGVERRALGVEMYNDEKGEVESYVRQGEGPKEGGGGVMLVM